MRPKMLNNFVKRKNKKKTNSKCLQNNYVDFYYQNSNINLSVG